jgi:hypothetical protein
MPYVRGVKEREIETVIVVIAVVIAATADDHANPRTSGKIHQG